MCCFEIQVYKVTPTDPRDAMPHAVHRAGWTLSVINSQRVSCILSSEIATNDNDFPPPSRIPEKKLSAAKLSRYQCGLRVDESCVT